MGGYHSSIKFNDGVVIVSDDHGAFFERFADAEASTKCAGGGCTQYGTAIENGAWEGRADDRDETVLLVRFE